MITKVSAKDLQTRNASIDAFLIGDDLALIPLEQIPNQLIFAWRRLIDTPLDLGLSLASLSLSIFLEGESLGEVGASFPDLDFPLSPASAPNSSHASSPHWGTSVATS